MSQSYSYTGESIRPRPWVEYTTEWLERRYLGPTYTLIFPPDFDTSEQVDVYILIDAGVDVVKCVGSNQPWVTVEKDRLVFDINSMPYDTERLKFTCFQYKPEPPAVNVTYELPATAEFEKSGSVGGFIVEQDEMADVRLDVLPFINEGDSFGEADS